MGLLESLNLSKTQKTAAIRRRCAALPASGPLREKGRQALRAVHIRQDYGRRLSLMKALEAKKL